MFPVFRKSIPLSVEKSWLSLETSDFDICCNLFHLPLYLLWLLPQTFILKIFRSNKQCAMALEQFFLSEILVLLCYSSATSSLLPPLPTPPNSLIINFFCQNLPFMCWTFEKPGGKSGCFLSLCLFSLSPTLSTHSLFVFLFTFSWGNFPFSTLLTSCHLAFASTFYFVVCIANRGYKLLYHYLVNVFSQGFIVFVYTAIIPAGSWTQTSLTQFGRVTRVCIVFHFILLGF